MQDFLGTEISEGDTLVFSENGTKKLIRGIVTGFTRTNVKVKLINEKDIEIGEQQRDPRRTAVFKKVEKPKLGLGTCPVCGTKAAGCERSPWGKTWCENGHYYSHYQRVYE